ncbi:MAG: chemotaxis protein CheB, partial [Pseudomonadota bacterium]
MTTNRMPEITAWVGIGASAGGLESLRRVIRSLPMDTGATFVIIQHVSPHHKSLLSALLARETELSVSEIENGVVPLPNAVYVAPPNNDVVMSGGRLQLHKTEGQANHARPSVDRFFRSLAEAVGGRAVGVVLSGTGRDGAYGVQAIRAAGGVTVAQTETTAKYYGMPGAAIETGCVDLVLSPEDLGRKLSKIICLPRDLSDVAYVEETRDSYLLLLQLLYSQCQIDFRQYKQSSIRRRVERRITALGMDGIEPYLEYARSTTSELEALLKDLLISVTSFFRDPQEFDALAKELAQSEFVESTRGLRVWVPGCATGEEAYSIAILLGEAFGGPEKLADAQVQIFATDIDAEALAVARIGTYPDAAFDQVSREQVEQYFNSTVGGYSAKSFLREKITFTQHNLCEDPPFSNIDLISCRNVLIYLGDETQERVLARLHYSLRLDGLLFLGKSEAPVKAPGQFRQADATARIYKRLSTKTADRLGKPVSYGTRANTIGPAPQKETEQDPAPTQMFDALVRILGLPAMVVTESYSILRVYGELDSFITLSEGIVSGVTLAMLRDTYRSDALQLVALALRNGELRTGIDRPCPDDAEMSIRIKAYPIAIEAAAERMVLVCFERRKLGVQKLATPSSQEIQDFDELRRELESTSNSLQQTVEELETTNEEL